MVPSEDVVVGTGFIFVMRVDWMESGAESPREAEIVIILDVDQCAFIRQLRIQGKISAAGWNDGWETRKKLKCKKLHSHLL